MRVVTLVLLLAPQLAFAQGGRAATTPRDSLLRHAQVLVNQGQGAAGRAIVDSLYNATRSGSPERANVMYMRATLAQNDSTAERDYQELVAGYPLSPRAADALVRLGLLEQTRRNRDKAKSYFERVKIEHPRSPAIAQAGYWLGRLYLEDNDVVRACGELEDARAALAAGDVEFRTQVEYYTQRCANLPRPKVDSTPPGGQRTASDSTPPGRAAGSAAVKPDSTEPARGRAGDSATDRAADSGGRAATARGSTARGSAPARGSATPPASRTTPAFSIQVAAFTVKSDATKLAENLTTRGYTARVVGDAKPFKVWIGRYPTSAEAAKVAQELKDKKVTVGAFVVPATDR